MKKFISVAVLATLVTVAFMAFAAGDGLVMPGLKSNEVHYYKSTFNNLPKEKIGADSLLRDIIEEYPKHYTEKVVVEGEGENRIITITRDEVLANDSIVKAEYKLRAGKTLVMLSSNRISMAPDGSVIREREYHYDEPTLHMEEGTYHFLVVDIFLRSQDLKMGSQHRMWAYLEPTLVIPMLFKVEGEEKLKVPAGEFDCWKVSLYLDKKKIDDLSSRMVALFFPKVGFWIQKEEPHKVIRINWPIPASIAGNKKASQIINLIKIEQ